MATKKLYLNDNQKHKLWKWLEDNKSKILVLDLDKIIVLASEELGFEGSEGNLKSSFKVLEIDYKNTQKQFAKITLHAGVAARVSLLLQKTTMDFSDYVQELIRRDLKLRDQLDGAAHDGNEENHTIKKAVFEVLNSEGDIPILGNLQRAVAQVMGISRLPKAGYVSVCRRQWRDGKKKKQKKQKEENI